MLKDRSHPHMDRSVRKPGDDERLLQSRLEFLGAWGRRLQRDWVQGESPLTEAIHPIPMGTDSQSLIQSIFHTHLLLAGSRRVGVADVTCVMEKKKN